MGLLERLIKATTAVENGSISGPPGPPGNIGPTGCPRWYGEGTPTVVIGANVGDEYVDILTGDLYVLQ